MLVFEKFIKKNEIIKNMSKYKKIFKKLFFENALFFKHYLKISLFRSPLDLNKNIRFKFVKFLSQLNYFFKNKKDLQINNSYRKKISKFKTKGQVTLTNKKIEENAINILKKLKEIKYPWTEDGLYNSCAINDFKEEFINIFKNGIDTFLKETLKSDYQIFSHALYRSIRKNLTDSPEGSQLWHWDGGPTSCINLMICLTPVNHENGSMRSISWPNSKKIHLYIYKKYRKRIKSKAFLKSKKLSRLDERSVKCKLIEDLIISNKIDFFQPMTKRSGLAYFFINNLVHSGGFGEEINKERIVSVFHIYPAINQTSVSEKFENIPRFNKPYPEI